MATPEPKFDLFEIAYNIYEKAKTTAVALFAIGGMALTVVGIAGRPSSELTPDEIWALRQQVATDVLATQRTPEERFAGQFLSSSGYLIETKVGGEAILGWLSGSGEERPFVGQDCLDRERSPYNILPGQSSPRRQFPVVIGGRNGWFFGSGGGSSAGTTPPKARLVTTGANTFDVVPNTATAEYPPLTFSVTEKGIVNPSPSAEPILTKLGCDVNGLPISKSDGSWSSRPTYSTVGYAEE